MQEVQSVSVARVMLLEYASALSDLGCLAGGERGGSAGSLPLSLSPSRLASSHLSVSLLRWGRASDVRSL